MYDAATARAWLEEQDVSNLVLEEAPGTKTGYANVKKVGKWFQAFLYDKSKPRGRQQVPWPGIFDTPIKAAQYRALMLQCNHMPGSPKPGRLPRGTGMLCQPCPAPRLTSLSSPFRFAVPKLNGKRGISKSMAKASGVPTQATPARISAENVAPHGPPMSPVCRSEAATVFQVRPAGAQLSPQSIGVPFARVDAILPPTEAHMLR